MPEPKSAEELASILDAHSRWIRGAEGGSRANLYGADLGGADLTRADLYGADLGGANLGGANLYGADLTRADLTGADLGGADLTGANLTRANLTGANLGGTKTLSRMLRLIGACQESIDWLEKQKEEDPEKLLKLCPPQYAQWLEDTLHGEPTMARLQVVVDYIAGKGFK